MLKGQAHDCLTFLPDRHLDTRHFSGHGEPALALSKQGTLIKEESQCWEVSRVTLQPWKN